MGPREDRWAPGAGGPFKESGDSQEAPGGIDAPLHPTLPCRPTFRLCVLKGEK